MFVELLKNLGYKRSEIAKICAYYSQSKDETVYNYIKDTYDYFEKKGYSKKDLKKMIVKFPAVVSYGNEKYDFIQNLILKQGFTMIQYKSLSKSLPAIYSYSKERYDNKKSLFNKYGYTDEEYIDICMEFPRVLGYSVENVYKKLLFYNKFSLDFIVKTDTRQLIQSAELTYARYMYLKNKGYEIGEDTYSKLYYSDKMFQRLHGISNEDLLNIYKFSEIIDVEDKRK